MKPIEFKADESFRPSYSFSNSPAALARFPFPFDEDHYDYAMNLEPHVQGGDGIYRANFDIDEHYVAECKDRAWSLETDHDKHYIALPNMMQAQWDLLELIMQSYARDYPEHFSLSIDHDVWTWDNRLLNVKNTFKFGDPSTLPYEPLEYITRQAQGEWVIVDDREDTLIWSAGMATERADYSVRFNVGMTWEEWHGPVPRITEMGILERALKFLKRLRVGHPVRRLNWTLTVNPRLETSAESLPEWAPDRKSVTAENVGRKVFMRVEQQPLHRLPRSNAIVFPVRTYLASLEELASVPKWGRRLHRVMRDLDPAHKDYKGFALYYDHMVNYLARFDDGLPTSPGAAAD